MRFDATFKVCNHSYIYSLPNIIRVEIQLIMQEFLSLYANIQTPTFEMVIFTYILALLLSILIALTYSHTTPNTLKSASFVQAMILSALISATVVQSTNNSLAGGVGLLGALTIIQFRSTFRNPRDVIFIFAAVSAGISCGSFVILPAIIGSLGFCFVAFLLRFTPFHTEIQTIFELRVRINTDFDKILFLEKVLNQYSRKWTEESMRNEVKNSGEIMYQELDFIVLLNDDNQRRIFLEALAAEGVIVKKFGKQNTDFTAND